MQPNTSASNKACQTITLENVVTERPRARDLPDSVGRIYRVSGNLLVIKDTYKSVPKQFVGTVRSSITAFSNGSAIRMRRYLRECLSDYSVMVTLTYPGFFTTNGKTVKNDLKRFLQELRRQYVRDSGDDGKHSSFWFLEFQSRGAPHFHIFTTWSPDYEWVAKRWYEIVNSEDIRHLHAGTRTEYLVAGRAGTISYASKYALKNEQKEVPKNYENVGRFWGVTGRRAVMSADTYVMASKADDPGPKEAIIRIHNQLQAMFLYGEAEIIHRDTGVMVVNILDYRNQVKMRTNISRLALQVETWSDMFVDAEVDFSIGSQELLPCTGQ